MLKMHVIGSKLSIQRQYNYLGKLVFNPILKTLLFNYIFDKFIHIANASK
jgi:hypothetical protein